MNESEPWALYAQDTQQFLDAIERDGAFAAARPAFDERWPAGGNAPGNEALLLRAELEQELAFEYHWNGKSK